MVKKVLLTGGSGFLGHRVLEELLTGGYKVRATCRPNKVSTLRSLFPDSSSDALDVCVVEDLIVADWPELLKDIDAVVHVAAPVAVEGVTSADMYQASVTATQNLLTAVGNAKGVQSFILAGSIAAFFKPDVSNVLQDVVFDENTYLELDDIDPAQYAPFEAYIACKAISDKLVWKAAAKYTHIDFTVVHPSLAYGKFANEYPLRGVDLNSNKIIYALLKPDASFPPFPVIAQIHVKDAARALVLALTAPPLPSGRKKRLIVSSEEMPWLEALEYLRAQRPELAGRLVKVTEETKKAIPPSHFKLDTKLTEAVLGMNAGNMIGWQQTLLEVVDWLVDQENKGVI